MIVITGAAGFIGSCLAGRLNREKFLDLALVDDFSKEEKKRNWEGKRYTELIDRNDFPAWLMEHHRLVEFVFHLGARTDTAETDENIFLELNLEYSKTIWKRCVEFGLPLVYASSAATYGDGSKGYNDGHNQIADLIPLNAYGRSKQQFDKWALSQEKKPYFWAGLKFFNVFGPNEYHKGRMASVVFHAHKQVLETGEVRLFKSHRPDFKDGQQKRDFIYVKDVADVCMWLMLKRRDSGIYNLGSGMARTFDELASAVFAAMNKKRSVIYIDTPADIRDKYQYFTCANMKKLRSVGYSPSFTTLEDGVADCIKHYLSSGKVY